MPNIKRSVANGNVSRSVDSRECLSGNFLGGRIKSISHGSKGLNSNRVNPSSKFPVSFPADDCMISPEKNAYNRFLKLIKEQNEPEIKRSLKNTMASVKWTDKQKYQLLKSACLSGSYEITEVLVKNGFLNDSYKDAEKMILFSIFFTSSKISEEMRINFVKLFIEYSQDFKTIDLLGRNLLMIACANSDDPEVISLLADVGVDLNLKDRYRLSAVTIAIRHNHMQVANRLFELLGSEIILNDEELLKSYLIYLTKQGKTSQVKNIFSKKNCENTLLVNELLCLSCKLGQSELVNFFLTKEVDVNSTDGIGKTLLMSVIVSPHSDDDTKICIMKSLHDSGADIHQFDTTHYNALMYAKKLNKDKIVAFLQHAGATLQYDRKQKLDAQEQQIKNIIKIGSNKDLEQILTDSTINLNNPFVDGENFLFSAIRATSETFDKIQTLLDRKINVNQRSYGGLTPLTLAIITRLPASIQCKIIDLLIRYGADVQECNPRDQNFCILSAHRPKVLQKFIDRKVDFNKADYRGDTPLIVAGRKSNRRSLEILMHFRADPTVKNKEGNDVLDILKSSENSNKLDIDNMIAYQKSYTEEVNT